MHMRRPGELSLLEAVDDLAHMAEVDKVAPQKEDSHESEPIQTISWQEPDRFLYKKERAQSVFRSILHYLQELYETRRQEISDPSVQRGIQALMLLMSEAVQKMDRWLKQSHHAESITELDEYKEVQQFYLTKIVQRFEGLIEIAEIPEAWVKHTFKIANEKERVGLKDVGAVRTDKQYELFFIPKQDGTSFFSRDLVRHMYLVRQCEMLLPDLVVEDPLARMKSILDKDLCFSAQEILHLASPYMEEFYKEAMLHKDKPFVGALNKALMALMLASKSRHLLQHTMGKCCLDYYADFHTYLRQALISEEYKHFILHPPKPSERFSRCLIHLAHVLSAAFFLRVSAKEEMSSFIRHLIERGGEGSITEEPTHTPLLEWNSLLDEDEHLRFFLHQYPNSPLKKALDLFAEEKALKGFDPVAQGNYPAKMFAIIYGNQEITCLRLGCPTEQTAIHKAHILDEFLGFLRSKKSARTLIINVQDRTSWMEHARSIALEELQKEFAESLLVVTLPKQTEFYMQIGPYLALNDAKAFMEQFQQQISSGEECGYFFPPKWNKTALRQFVKEGIPLVHTLFFGSKSHLVHKNRQDFIEIFYLLLVLKMIELFKPEVLSFTCKDAIDISPAANAELFGFLRMLHSPSPWTQDEKNLFLWILYSPALLFRERAIDIQRFSRMIGALSIVQAALEVHFDRVVHAISSLYEEGFLQEIAVHSIHFAA